MISNKSNTPNVLPNFIKTALVIAAAATSVSAFAGDHEKGEKIGDLKDMKKKEVMLKEDEMKSSLVDSGSVEAETKGVEEKMDDKAKELKAEAPEG